MNGIATFLSLLASLITICAAIAAYKRRLDKHVRKPAPSRVEIVHPDQFPTDCQKPKHVLVDIDGIGFLHRPDSNDYVFINKNSLDSPLKVLMWVRELSKKKWFSVEMCSDFISANMTLFGWLDEFGQNLNNILSDHKIATRHFSKREMKHIIKNINREDTVVSKRGKQQ